MEYVPSKENSVDHIVAQEEQTTRNKIPPMPSLDLENTAFIRNLLYAGLGIAGTPTQGETQVTSPPASDTNPESIQTSQVECPAVVASPCRVTHVEIPTVHQPPFNVAQVAHEMTWLINDAMSRDDFNGCIPQEYGM